MKQTLFAFSLFINLCLLHAQTKRYVSANGAANADGLSWNTASSNLQSMINQSMANDSVFVAGGEYTAASYFYMKDGVKIYGGFTGTENSLAERNLNSGDTSILRANGSSVIYNNNNGLTLTAILDGFKITGARNSLTDGSGGGVYNFQVGPTFSNVTISGNMGCYGGGMYNFRSNPMLTNVIIRDNIATFGGGLYNRDGLSGNYPMLKNVLIIKNIAMGGGGMYCQGAMPNIYNATISDNKALTLGGGGIWSEFSANPTLYNCILWGNKGYLYNAGDGASVLDVLASGVVGTPSGNDIHTDMEGQIRLFYSLFSNSPQNLYQLTAGSAGFIGTVDADPEFIDSAAGNFKLKGYSPAINAGNNFNALLLTGLPDLAGNPRIFEEATGGIIDMGAYEYQNAPIVLHSTAGILYVDSSAGPDGDGSSWAKALSSFGVALNTARSINAASAGAPADSVHEIWVAQGTYQPGAGASFTMLPRVKIYGGFAGTETALGDRELKAANTSILKGNGLNVIYNAAVSLDSSAVLDGFNITDGTATVTGRTQGGGIYNDHASPRLMNLTVMGNKATSGGGIFNNVSAPQLINVIVKDNNSSAQGGGISNASSTAQLTNVVISGNVASSIGGGIYNYKSSSQYSNVRISDNIATSNEGGGMLSYLSTEVMVNCLIAYNTATTGSGLMLYDGTIRLNNSTIVANNGEGINLTRPSNTSQISNAIVWGNTEGLRVVSTAIPSIKYSIIQGRTDNTNGNKSADLSMKFVDSANGNFQLQPTSPALNAGTPDTTGLMLPLTDLAGNPRIFGDTIDMGAYEVQSLIPLPVHILAFTGSLVNEVARLQWLSGVEENLDYYELEMSVDGKKYVPLHSTSAKGNNFQYNYDFTQLADKAFYRLRSVDKNGQSAYLDKIIFLSKEAGAGNILIYPNPARKYIMVKTQAPDILTIYNAVGKQVARKALTEGINRINIENLSAGVYYGVMGHHKFQILKK